MFGFPELLIAAMAAQTPAQAAVFSPYRVDVNLVLYRGEQVSARAGSGSENNLDGYVWMDESGCMTGAGGGASASSPMAGMRWHYTGVVTRQPGSAVTVDVTWGRVGEPSAAAQHREVTIHNGETVTLESIQVPASNSCGITAARLTLSMGPQVMSGRGGGGGGARGSFPGGGRGGAGAGAGGMGAGGTGGGGTGAGGGVSAGRAGGRGMGAGGGSAAGVGGFGGVSGVGGSRGGRGVNVAENATTLARYMGGLSTDESGGVLTEIPGVAYDAELWLVHTAPGSAAEETQRLPMHVSSASDVVTFSPVSIQTAAGDVRIEVAAVVRAMATSDGKQVLRVVIARAARPSQGTAYSIGNTMKVIPSPAIGNVVSFEIPESWSRRGGGGGAVGAGAIATGAVGAGAFGGHQFSVRLQLKSKAQQ